MPPWGTPCAAVTLRAVRRLAIIAMASTALGASCAVPTPPNAAAVVVSPTPQQTISAFGASGAWWPNDLAHFPVATRRAVVRLLFTPQGIALSGYRYNIGGGGVGVTTPARAPHQFRDDTAGRAFLRAAHSARVPIL